MRLWKISEGVIFNSDGYTTCWKEANPSLILFSEVYFCSIICVTFLTIPSENAKFSSLSSIDCFTIHVETMNALKRCSRVRSAPRVLLVRSMSESPRERTLVPAQRKGMDYSQPPGLRTDAINKAYEGKVDSLDVFMSKAFPSGPRNSAEWAVMQIDKVNSSHLILAKFFLSHLLLRFGTTQHGALCGR